MLRTSVFFVGLAALAPPASAETRKLSVEEALALALDKSLDVPARVRAIRSQPPAFSKIEHFPEHGEETVRLIRRAAQPVVQLGYVLPCNIADLPFTKRRQDDAAE